MFTSSLKQIRLLQRPFKARNTMRKSPWEMQTKEAHFNSGAWLIEIRVSFLASGLRFKSGQCGSNAVWNRWSYVLSSVTWGFITKTTTLIGTFAEEPIEGESWRLTKVQLTRLPLRCSLLKATDKTHYTAAASWNATPSIDQMAPSPSSTVPSHNHYISLWRGGAGVYVTHRDTQRKLCDKFSF